MMKKSASIALCLFLLLGASVQAAPAPSPAAKAPAAAAANGPQAPMPLPQQAIHIAYNEGDFDKVVAEIEAFTKVNRTHSRADSVFIAKHLAVVYTANPGTREKGKYYMYRLLEMVPSAELVDMFVSDEIDRIFDKVRKEFLARQQSFGVDSTQISIPDKPAGKTAVVASATTEQPAQSAEPAPAPAAHPFYKKKGFWMMTGAGIAAVGAVVTFVHTQEEAAGKSYAIPAQ